jgi:hypothetical protein
MFIVSPLFLKIWINFVFKKHSNGDYLAFWMDEMGHQLTVF